MTDYGLKELTDDQFLDLMQSMCQEACLRDRFVYDAAQECVYSWAEQLKIAKQGMAKALKEAKANYIRQAEEEVAAWVKEAIETGEIELLTPGQEAHLVVTSAIKAKIAEIDKILDRMNSSGCTERFLLQIAGNELTVTYGSNKVTSKHNLTNTQVRQMTATLRQTLNA